MNTEIILTPAQRTAAEGLQEACAFGGVLVLRGRAGSGKTTILQGLHAICGGALLDAASFLRAVAHGAPNAMEESFLRMIEEAMAHHNLVFVDDLHLVANVLKDYNSPRSHLLDAALTAILAEAAVWKKTLVFAVEDEAPFPIQRRATVWEIGDFTPEDYACILREFAPTATPDAGRVHRFAPALSGHQLRNAGVWLARNPAASTEDFTEYLREHNLASNVEVSQVAAVDWKDLKGVDDVIRALEAKIALPLENDALASELRLKPKRGVLLAGPPGTGKTTIGRALAHRLKSKFFLIDGTMVAGSSDFYEELQKVFDAARRNAPSIVFIDDSDVMFEGNGDPGLYRYLLTVLDGIQSAGADRVCVMMTAMNPGSLPPAMLRSGRVELWLETRLPDPSAREEILRERLIDLPGPLAQADVVRVAEAAHGLTGADLKGVVEDAKLLFAHDVSTATPTRGVDEYFLDAIREVHNNHRNYTKKRPAFATTARIGF
jgi:tRNA A37 threonylcarbamoyladenosine biosynthesis protein TsaE